LIALIYAQVIVVSDVSVPLAATSRVKLRSLIQVHDHIPSIVVVLSAFMSLAMICVMLLAVAARCLAYHQ
jgi:hypothetical protein